MSGWDKRYRKIHELIGNTGKRVFLVEGEQDVQPYKLLFTKKFGSGWETRWELTHAGKKQHVLEMLQVEQGWLGLVDLDEWDDQDVDSHKEQIPNLLVLPRYCMESYLCNPTELWETFPEEQKNKIDGGFERFEQEMKQGLEQWVKHGVLWSVVNPLWEGIRSLGFKERLLELAIAQNNDQIRSTLQDWYDYLEPDRLFIKFTERLAVAEQADDIVKLNRWVHGKHFWTGHVSPTLNRLLRQQNSAEDRRTQIWRDVAIPADWEEIWDRIEAINLADDMPQS